MNRRRLGTASATVLITLGLTASPAFARAGHRAGNWEVVFGHRNTAAAAQTLAQLVDKKGFGPASIERDGKRDFEVEHDGFTTQKSALAAAQRVSKAGLLASIERS